MLKSMKSKIEITKYLYDLPLALCLSGEWSLWSLVSDADWAPQIKKTHQPGADSFRFPGIRVAYMCGYKGCFNGKKDHSVRFY